MLIQKKFRYIQQ
ncbi:unnamed protein product, partial [Allacma fusca]